MSYCVCDSCGHLWTDAARWTCPECKGSVVYIWQDAARVNALAHSYRVKREREAQAS